MIFLSPRARVCVWVRSVLVFVYISLLIFLFIFGEQINRHSGYCIIGFLEFIGRLTKYKTHCARAKNVINMRHIIIHNGYTFCVPHDIKKSINVAAEQTTFRPIWDFAALSFTWKSVNFVAVAVSLFQLKPVSNGFWYIFIIILIMPFWIVRNLFFFSCCCRRIWIILQIFALPTETDNVPVWVKKKQILIRICWFDTRLIKWLKHKSFRLNICAQNLRNELRSVNGSQCRTKNVDVTVWGRNLKSSCELGAVLIRSTIYIMHRTAHTNRNTSTEKIN